MKRSVLVLRFFLLAVLAAAGFGAFWQWSHDKWLDEARSNFKSASYAVEQKILKELDILASSRVNSFVDTQRFTFDRKRGLVRHFPVDEIEVRLYFPQNQWDAMLAEGKGEPGNSPAYKAVRARVIQLFDERFADPWLTAQSRSRITVFYKIKAGPEDRPREQMLREFREFGKQ